MLFQIKGVWFMVAKPRPAVRKRVQDKLAKRECLVPDCTCTMVVRGLCRRHYDAAEMVVNKQPTPELRAKASERLITQGLMLEAWKQPRPAKDGNGKVFEEAVA